MTTEKAQQTVIRVIGLMSGTSVDGIDAALVEIGEEAGTIHWRLLHFSSIPWSAVLKEAILSACRSDAPLQFVTALNFRLGYCFAEAARTVAGEAGFPLTEISLIASHGQTIWHQPSPITIAGRESIGTTQIGEPAVIATETGCLVIADFRTADMAVQGQGAPLVPFADHILFSDTNETRAVQNLGGIANVTFLQAGGGLENILAFDTGPGNMVLDALASRVTDGAQQCDKGGQMALRGDVNMELLNCLLEHPYFAAPPPKSTGREEFGLDYAAHFFRLGLIRRLNRDDLLATATALTAETVAGAYRRFLLPICPINRVIIGGGGVHNRALVKFLTKRIAPAQVSTHTEFGLPDDAKEAAAFAMLGYTTLMGRPSNVPSATGATQPAILGKIAFPPNPTGPIGAVERLSRRGAG